MNLNLQQVRYLTDSSFFHFCRIIGGSVEQGGDIIKPIHEKFCQVWQNPRLKRVGAGMPRGWRKTTVLTGWDIIYTYLQDAEERQLIGTEKERLGVDILKWIKGQLLRNELLRKIYWDKLYMINDAFIKSTTWSSTIIDLPKKGIYPSPSVRVIGIRAAAQGGHYTTIHLDDIIGEASIESPLIMEDAQRWMDNVPELLVEPDHTKLHGSRVKITGSPWGSGDIYDYTRDKYREYKWMIAPCRKDEGLKDEDNLTWIQNDQVAHSESNFPLFPTDYYKEMESNPEKQQIFWAQHACQPQKAAGFNKFKYDWLKFYKLEEDSNGERWVVCLKDDGKEEERFNLKDIPLFGMIDPGGFAETKSMKKGSRVAILIGGQPHNSTKKFVIYTWSKKIMEPQHFLDEVFKAHDTFKPREWRIETIGAQQYIYRDILEERRKRKSYLSISPFPKDKSKDVKEKDITALINPFFNGTIYIHRDFVDFISEYKSFPRGLTRDLLDMCAKLNRYYWTRRKMIDVSKIAQASHVQSVQDRCEITGY